MYKDLSLKEKAKVIREGVRLGFTSIDDILDFFDKATSSPKDPPIILKANKSKADFMQRLKDPNRLYIRDWENPDNIATHKLSWAEDDQGAIVYPLVQNINGKLVDFSRPPYSEWAGYDSAIRTGDTIRMSPLDAEWFTTHYKDYYPSFNEYATGGPLGRLRYLISAKTMEKAREVLESNKTSGIDPSRGEPHNGMPQATFLLSQPEQKKYFERYGYTDVTDKGYGPFTEFITQENKKRHTTTPVYQTYPDAKVNRNDLIHILDSPYGAENYEGPVGSWFTDAGEFTNQYYIDSKTGDVYNQAWDYNDYLDTGKHYGRYKYHNSPMMLNIVNRLGNIMNRLGNPMVVTTGLQKRSREFDYPYEVRDYLQSKGLYQTFTDDDPETSYLTLPQVEVIGKAIKKNHNKATGGPIVSPYGQWKYPGKDTIIPSNNITMNNVNYPVLGISDTGDTKVMMPWNNYKFKGSIVYEHPLIGNQFQLGGNTLNYLNVPEYNIALYNTVSPLGDFPNFWEALAYKRLVKDKLKNGNIYERDYKVGDTQGEKTAMAAWAKRLGIPYDELDLPVYNGDTVMLPPELVLEIPYDTNMLKNRIQLNKALLDKYSKYRYSDVVDAAIKADLYNLDKLRETYKTGKPVGLTEFGWNSRLLVNNGEIIPIEEIQSPLNVLGNYNVRYSPEERRLYYSDEYDFNQFENFVPGEPFRIRGYIDLDNNKASGGNLFKKGGIHINPKNKGKFNATKKRTGKTTEELTHSKNPLTRKRAIFAQNAKKWHHKHDEGGYLYSEGGFLLAPYLDVE